MVTIGSSWLLLDLVSYYWIESDRVGYYWIESVITGST